MVTGAVFFIDNMREVLNTKGVVNSTYYLHDLDDRDIGSRERLENVVFPLLSSQIIEFQTMFSGKRLSAKLV